MSMLGGGWATETLGDRLRSFDEHVRRVALEAVSCQFYENGADQQEASAELPQVLSLVTDDEFLEVRKTAASAAGALAGACTWAQVEKLLVPALLRSSLNARENSSVRSMCLASLASALALGTERARGGGGGGGGGGKQQQQQQQQQRELQQQQQKQHRQQALQRGPPEAVAGQNPDLELAKSAVRESVAAKLAGLATEKQVPEEVEVAAVLAISRLGQASCLLDFLKQEHSTNVVKAATVELSSYPEVCEREAELLARLLRHGDPSVRLAAIQACGEVGLGSPESLIRTLGGLREDRNRRLRLTAIQSLARCGELAASELVAFCGDCDAEVQHAAAEAFGSLKSSAAARVVRDALVALGEGNTLTKCALIQALGRMGAMAADHTEDLLSIVGDSDMSCRLSAVQALGSQGPTAAPAVAASLGALHKHQSKALRHAAVSSLLKMGERGAEQLVLFLDDEDAAVRQAVAKGFSPYHSPMPAEVAVEHIDSIAFCLLDEDWRVRFSAVATLGDLKASGYANEVSALCGDENAQVRRSAVSALGKMSAPRMLVAKFIGDSDAQVQREASLLYDRLQQEPSSRTSHPASSAGAIEQSLSNISGDRSLERAGLPGGTDHDLTSLKTPARGPSGASKLVEDLEEEELSEVE